MENSGLEVVARGEQGEVRAVELAGSPFSIGTLFQPNAALSVENSTRSSMLSFKRPRSAEVPFNIVT